jgi:hypothetical protein
MTIEPPSIKGLSGPKGRTWQQPLNSQQGVIRWECALPGGSDCKCSATGQGYPTLSQVLNHTLARSVASEV